MDRGSLRPRPGQRRPGGGGCSNGGPVPGARCPVPGVCPMIMIGLHHNGESGRRTTDVVAASSAVSGSSLHTASTGRRCCMSTDVVALPFPLFRAAGS